MTLSTNGNKHNTLHVSHTAIQYAHDLLNAVLTDDLPVPIDDIMELDDEIVAEMAASMNVLCWLLGHDNTRFIDNLKNMEQALDDAGIVLELGLDN